MNTASSPSHGIRDAAKETVRDVREGMREFGKAAAASSGDLQKDLQALREDFSRLAEQFADILADKGEAAWQRAKAGAEDVAAGAREKEHEAADALREISDHLIGAIDESLKERPYATLAIAAGLGFLLGMTWRR
jgi:ElaB/YqjD/DUF883 family membrane-anchored ribosome-binding protein